MKKNKILVQIPLSHTFSSDVKSFLELENITYTIIDNQIVFEIEKERKDYIVMINLLITGKL